MLDELKHIIQTLTTEYDTDVKYRIDVLPELRRVAEEMKKCQSNITTLEKNTNMLQKQLQLSTLDRKSVV